jgi:hypothetical protein
MRSGAHKVSQLVYIPIFDQLAWTGNQLGVQAVLEVMVHRRAADAMIVANTITFLGSSLPYLQVSLDLCGNV